MFPVTEQLSDYQLTCQDMIYWGGELMLIKWGIVKKKKFSLQFAFGDCASSSDVGASLIFAY